MEKKYEEIYSMLKLKENQILVLQTEVSNSKIKLIYFFVKLKLICSGLYYYKILSIFFYKIINR